MPLLFSYGTLRDPEVQLSVFGRALTAFDDHLPGFEQALELVSDPEFVRTSGKSRHAILRPAAHTVAPIKGMALEVTERELLLADEYEPAGYNRVKVTLASGREAWVYIDARFCQSDDRGGDG